MKAVPSDMNEMLDKMLSVAIVKKVILLNFRKNKDGSTVRPSFSPPPSVLALLLPSLSPTPLRNSK